MSTPRGASRPGSLGKRVAQATALAMLSAGAVGMMAAGPAAAAGTSSKIFNCYTQWWNTAWAQKCDSPGAQYAGTYVSGVACSSEPDKTMSKGRTQGSTATYSGSDCTFGASNGWISYL